MGLSGFNTCDLKAELLLILNSKPREEFQKWRFVQIFLLVVGREAEISAHSLQL